jgi:hypothetical protein
VTNRYPVGDIFFWEGVNDPLVVVILVSVGSDLLLSGSNALRVQVPVRVEVAAACAVVLERNHAAIRNFYKLMRIS